MLDTQPLITIGMTAFNAADTVKRAVSSAQAQEWGNFEIVIIDDASTDATLEVLNSFQGHNLHVITNTENKGVAAARNQIITHAKGQFIAFFDDDDISAPSRLGEQYEALTEFEKKLGTRNILCHSARLQIYPGGAQHIETVPGTDLKNIPGGEDMAVRILTGKPCAGGFGSMATCSQMARRETYTTLGGFDESFRRCEDTDLAIRHAQRGGYFIGIAQPLVTQMMSYGSDKTLDAEEKAWNALLEKHKPIIDRTIHYNLIKQWNEARFDYLRGNKSACIKKLLKLALCRPVCTMRKLLWAMPNRKFHTKQKDFHGE